MRTETDAQLAPKEQINAQRIRKKIRTVPHKGKNLITTKMSPSTQLGQSLPSKRNPPTQDEE